MRTVFAVFVLLFACAVNATDVDINYKKYVLDNGLTLIVHEDHKAPIVAVNVWYHVGSKNEKEGRTGFAHLFEHLMFNGSEGYDDDYFKVMDRIGATDLNGTTNDDRTNYFQNVPKNRARSRAVDGIRPHGPPARRDRRRARSTSSAAWCRTRNARAKTSPTARSSSRLSRTSSPKATRTRGP